MATRTESSVDGLTEHCEPCGAETVHEVGLKIVTESSKTEGAEFSREPYRVTECLECGTRIRTRMNDV